MATGKKTKSAIPPELVITKDIVSNNLALISGLPDQRDCLNVAPKNGIHIYTFVSLDFESLRLKYGDETRTKIDILEQMILDAMNTFKLNGLNMVSYSQIYQLITGDETAQLKKYMHMYQIIVDAVEKFMNVQIFINAKAEAEEFKKQIPSKDCPLLDALPIEERSVNGSKETFVYINAPSPLYSYADSKNEVLRISKQILNAPIRRTPDTCRLIYFLIKRIEAIKGSKGRMSNVIRFYGEKGIYAAVGIDASDAISLTGQQRKMLLNIRNKVFVILDYWASDSIKYIEGYTKNSRGKGDKLVSISVRYKARRKGNKPVIKGNKPVIKGNK